MMRRGRGLLILSILIGAVIGSAITYIFGGLFPSGPVRSFFFKSLSIGFDGLKISLGFLIFTLSLWFKISIMTIISVFVVVYLLRKY